jgi:hypothetical protein
VILWFPILSSVVPALSPRRQQLYRSQFRKLRERLRKMTDEELIKFGREVRKLAENPFQRQLDEARAEWKRRKNRNGSRGV